MTHKQMHSEVKTIIPLSVELLSLNDYKLNLEDYELYSNNYVFQIKEGFVSKELIYFNRGSYFEQDCSEFSELEIEINNVKVFNSKDEEIELTDNQHLAICNLIRVHKIHE